MAMNTETFSVFKDQAIKVNSATPVATLLVPDGQWAIFAKLNLDNDSPEVHTVNCKLSAGVDFDQNVARLGPSGVEQHRHGGAGVQRRAYVSGHELTSQERDHVAVFLDKTTASVAAGRIKITAIRVASITNKPAA